MRKDFKTGFLIGTGLVICIMVVISIRPGETVEWRLRKYRDVRPGETSDGEVIQTRPASAQTRAQDSGQATAAGAPPSSQPRIHVVSEGETLSSVSKMYYGDTNKRGKIIDANPIITNENKLRPGMRLVIPQ